MGIFLKGMSTNLHVSIPARYASMTFFMFKFFLSFPPSHRKQSVNIYSLRMRFCRLIKIKKAKMYTLTAYIHADEEMNNENHSDDDDDGEKNEIKEIKKKEVAKL